MRWLSRSQKYRAPSGPMTTPWGLLTSPFDRPGAPLPITVRTLPTALNVCSSGRVMPANSSRTLARTR